MRKFLLSLFVSFFIVIPVASAVTFVGGSRTATNLSCTDCVDDTHVNWGTGAGQVSGSDLPDEDVGDVTITSGVWAVEDDSHAHTSTTITLASTDLTDTADLLYEAELDTFSELQTQIADKTLVNEEDAVTWDSAHTFNSTVDTTNDITITKVDGRFTVDADASTGNAYFDMKGNRSGAGGDLSAWSFYNKGSIVAEIRVQRGNTDTDGQILLRTYDAGVQTDAMLVDEAQKVTLYGDVATSANIEAGGTSGYYLGSDLVINDDGTDIQFNAAGNFTDIKASNGSFKGPYKSVDGSAGITSATCSAWKNGLCTTA